MRRKQVAGLPIPELPGWLEFCSSVFSLDIGLLHRIPISILLPVRLVLSSTNGTQIAL